MKPKIVFKFNDGENVEMSTLTEGYNFEFVKDLQNVKNNNGTLHIGHPGKEISKNASNLQSIEIFFD